MADPITAEWRKVLLSGSNAYVHELTASGIVASPGNPASEQVLVIGEGGAIYYTGSYGSGGGGGTADDIAIAGAFGEKYLTLNNGTDPSVLTYDNAFKYNATTNHLTVGGDVSATWISASEGIQHTDDSGTTISLASDTINIRANANSLGKFSTNGVDLNLAGLNITTTISGNLAIHPYDGTSPPITNVSAAIAAAAASGGGGTPGGSDTYIQYNDGGSFAGVSNFTFNKSTTDPTVTIQASTGGGNQAKLLLTASNAGQAILHLKSLRPEIRFEDEDGNPDHFVYQRDTRLLISNTNTLQGPIAFTPSSGLISSSGNFIINEITSSGDISSSLDISARKFAVDNNVFADYNSGKILIGDAGAIIPLQLLGSSVTIGTALTASIISASGTNDNNFGGRIILDNAKYFVGTQNDDTTTRNLLGIDASDIVQIGNANIPTNIKGLSITASGDFTVTGSTLTVTNTNTPKIRLLDTSNNYYTDLVQGNASSGIELNGNANQNFYISTNYFTGTTSATTALHIDGGDGEITFNEGLVSISSTGIISASTSVSASFFYGKTGNFVSDVTSPIISASTELGTDADIYAPNLPAGVDNSVIIQGSDGYLKTDEIDSRVWGSTLVDVTGTPADSYLAVWTDSNTIEGTNALTYATGTLQVGGKAGQQATNVIYTPPTLTGKAGFYKSGIEVNATDFTAEGESTGEIFNAVKGALITATEIVYYSKTGVWAQADAATAGPAAGMLGLAINTGTTTEALTKGYMVISPTQIGGGTFGTGSTLYLGTSSGMFQASPPGKAGHTIRKVGWVMNGGLGKSGSDVLVRFDPSNDFITN